MIPSTVLLPRMVVSILYSSVKSYSGTMKHCTDFLIISPQECLVLPKVNTARVLLD